MLEGLDPYSLDALSAVAGRPILLPFLYPAAGLVCFLPFAGLSFATAAALWVGLKLLLLGGLVELVRRTWLPTVDRLWIALVAVFGGAASALVDLRSGNVALLETALWMAGLAAFTGGRARVAAALFVAAAAWKVWPAAFLLLFLLPLAGRRARPGLAVGGLVLVALLVVAPGALAPWGGFAPRVGVPGAPFPVGNANPSLLAAFEEWARAWTPSPHSPAPAAWIAWALAGVITVALFRGAIARALRCGAAGELALLAGAGIAFLHPRPMAYGWVGGTLCAFALAAPRLRGPIEPVGLGVLLTAQGLAVAALHPWTGGVTTLGPPLGVLLALGLARWRERTPS